VLPVVVTVTSRKPLAADVKLFLMKQQVPVVPLLGSIVVVSRRPAMLLAGQKPFPTIIEKPAEPLSSRTSTE
jgi:hypothetical protein